ncbi:MAG: hypothetical protein EXS16_00865 [Gemmataceae bacterium]|nr:hypothetical protein [Gemmataceae bacterium]
MVRQAIRTIREDDAEPGKGPHRRESIRQALDDAGVARCPLCQVPLIARQTCVGPRFCCACSARWDQCER